MTTVDNDDLNTLNNTVMIDDGNIESNVNTLSTEMSTEDKINKKEKEDDIETTMMSSSSPTTDSKQRKKRKSKDTDFEPPLASINKLVKSILPSKLQITKDARSAFQRASGIFIFYLTHAANDIAKLNKRSTILPKDVIAALKELEYSEFVDPVEKVCEEFRESQAAAKAKNEANSNSNSNSNTNVNNNVDLDNNNDNEDPDEASVDSNGSQQEPEDEQEEVEDDADVDVDEMESMDGNIEADDTQDDTSMTAENEDHMNIKADAPAVESEEA